MNRVGLEEAKIIPDIIDRVASASAAELEVSFHGKTIKVGADEQGQRKETAGAPCTQQAPLR